jgi:hypothetical protein
MARQVEHGGIIVGGTQVASTLKCPHCGAHFTRNPGSGKLKSWCLKCNAETCGKWACMLECIPEEARLEYVEGTKTKYDDKIKTLLAEGAQLL